MSPATRARVVAAACTAVLVATALAGCTTARQPEGDTGCPPTLANAIASSQLIAGAQRVSVSVVPASDMGQPTTAQVLGAACVLRIEQVYRVDAPLEFLALVPGGGGTADAIGIALAKDGWSPSPNTLSRGFAMTGALGAIATVQGFEAGGIADVLPPRAVVPEESAYARDPVVRLSLSLRVARFGADGAG